MRTGFSYFKKGFVFLRNKARRMTYRILFIFYKKSFSSAWKRDLFIGSLMSCGSNKEYKLNQDTLRKLVELFTLGTNGKALAMAYEVKDLIWKDILLSKSLEIKGVWYSLAELKNIEVEDTVLVKAVEKIYNETPGWLKYGSPFLLKRDILKVFLYCKQEKNINWA